MTVSNRIVAVVCALMTLICFMAIFGSFFVPLNTKIDTAAVIVIQIALSGLFALMAWWSWYAESWVPVLILVFVLVMGICAALMAG